jgi:predicted dehydrogenase
MHAACYAQIEGVELAAVTDLVLENAEKIANSYSCRVFGDAEKLVANGDVEIIDVCLPTYLHAKYTLQALEAGKHVVCEKPIALTVEDGKKMVEAARRTGRRFMVGHVIRFWPEYVELKRFIDSGELGKLKALQLSRWTAYPHWSDWLTNPEKSGGAIVDLHIHDADALIWLLGEPKDFYVRGTIDRVVVFYDYGQDGPEIVSVEGGFLPGTVPFHMAFRAVFEKGTLDYDSAREKPASLLICRKGAEAPEPWRFTPPRELRSVADLGGNISAVWPYLLELEYFVNCVRQEKDPEVVTGDSAVAALKLVLREREAIKAV